MQPRLILLDADGTVWRGEAAIPEAPGFIRRAQAAGIRCLLVSNNAGPDRAMYHAKCRALGLDFAPEDIFSVNHLAGPYMAQHYPGARVLVIGSEQLAASMRGYIEVTGAEEYFATRGMPPLSAGRCRPVVAADLELLREANFDAVVVGIDLNVNYLRLALGCAAIERGARLIGANQDPTFPIEDGLELPGNGGMVRLIAAVTGATPEFMGKPEPHLLHQITAETGVPFSAMVVVGDRYETDIVLAQRAGIPAFLVLTGVTAAENAPPSQPGVSIARTLDDVAEELGIQ
jgi:4-nitrophenyl phosphatase